VNYGYDFAGRLTNRNSAVDGTVSLQYNGNDAVTNMADSTGSTTNLYDSAGRMQGIDYPTGASVRYALDALGRVTNVTVKASAGGTAYVTGYQYDAVGNVINVVDPLGHATGFGYDMVGRRTQRTLPNGVVTTYLYDWRDRVTNIVHKTGGTTNAWVGYVRGMGGEPLRITREDGSYVLPAYDGALRLTNEVYYNAGNAAQATNSYGYDASGTRIRLVTGGVVNTNAVTAGYRVTQVKTNGTVVETYGYDNGGRTTNVVRNGVALNLGYNTADQVTSITNGSTVYTYTYDGSGRRVKASGGSDRQFVTAPLATSGLESPYLVADGSGSVQQGYVYLGLEPLLRYDAAGNAVYYLEDGMGSVVGLADAGGSSVASFQYDGFGNLRSETGSTNAPSGTGGDYRFQGAWLETALGFYHLRARDYDSHTGRFLSRDPAEGEFKEPETINPYAFANDNPNAFTDPSGLDTLIEVAFTEAIGDIEDAAKAGGAAAARRKFYKTLGQMAEKQFTSYLKSLIPWDGMLKGSDPFKLGDAFQKKVEKLMCDVIPLLRNWLWLEPRVRGKTSVLGKYEAGDVYSNGIGCQNRETEKRPGGPIPRPDFIISIGPPKETSSIGILVGEIKTSGQAFEQAYLGTSPRQAGQWNAITGYAYRKTWSKTALLISFRHIPEGIKRKLLAKGVDDHTVVIPISILPQ